MNEIRERRVERRRQALSLATDAVVHLYTPETKTDDTVWLCDRIREMADVFEADLAQAETRRPRR
jgi:hypothetical protein